VHKNIEQNKLLNGTVNKNLDRLKDILLFTIQCKYVPLIKSNSKRKKMWLTYKALKCVQCKHKVLKKYKDKNHHACIRASRIVSREVKKAKINFERKLAKNINKNSKSFFDYVWGRSCATRKLGPLTDNVTT